MSGPNEDQNPHIRDEFSPLDTLMRAALRRYGEFSTDTIDGDVAMMVIEMANEIVDDIHMHPYATEADTQIDYYVSLQDARPIHDAIMRAGLLYKVADQQSGGLNQAQTGNYYRTLNMRMWEKLNGNTAIRMRQVGDGTSPNYRISNRTKPVNGLPDT